MINENKKIGDYDFSYGIYNEELKDSDVSDKLWHYNHIRNMVNDAISNGICVLNITDIEEIEGTSNENLVPAFYEFVGEHEDKFIIVESGCVSSDTGRSDLVDDDIIGVHMDMDHGCMIAFVNNKTSKEVLYKS